MAIRRGDRARFNRRTKKFAKRREASRAHRAALVEAAGAKAPETKPKE
jgi:hypothetical protein